MSNNFNYRGISSNDFDIKVLRIHNSLVAPKRKSKILIAGRDGMYDQSDDTYNERRIEFDCMLIDKDIKVIRDKTRLIASWLSKKGELELDSEKGKFYTAEVENEIDLESIQPTQSFTLSFICFPFAMSRPITQRTTVSKINTQIPIMVEGTAKTPPIIMIKNVGTTAIHNIRIEHKKEI